MTNKFTILSPHLDDAVWSLGGYLKSLESISDIRVINIFSKQSFAFEKSMDPTLATEIRKNEDKKALNWVGIADIRYLDIPEALMRGYSKEKMFLDFENDIEDPVGKILEKLLAELIKKEDMVLIPSAFGGHIDHIITRNVAMRISCNHVFYEDLPYAARTERRSVAERFLANKGLKKAPATKLCLENHMRLTRMYKSQIAGYRLKQIRNYIQNEGYNLWV
jgi:LmbE family N-acetylglucosaminyl deacetylase